MIEDILDAERGKHPWDRLSIKAIHEQLVTQHGATGISYRTIHRHIADRRQGTPSGLPDELIEDRDDVSADHDCPCCDIAAERSGSQHLIVLQTGQVFPIPALYQQSARPAQIVVLPFDHVTALHKASPGLLAELFSMVARITAAMPAAFDGSGSTTVQHNYPPAQNPQHLHIRIVPGITGEQLDTPSPAATSVRRQLRTDIARELRRHLK